MRRTQIYLDEDRLIRLRRWAARRDVSMAEAIRLAIDAFLRREGSAEPEAHLDATFGALPTLEVPSRSEWDRAGG